jgi:hypothetical protein
MSEQQQNAYPRGWREHDADYDPRGALMQQRGRDYLDVQSRIRWFVRDQRALIVAGVATTTYEIRSTIIEHDAATGFAMFSAYVRDVLGNECTMFGSETRMDFGDYLEKANTKAVGRALIALGYSTGSAQDLDEDPERPADAPRERRQQGAQQQRQGQPQGQPQGQQQASRQPTPIRREQLPQPAAEDVPGIRGATADMAGKQVPPEEQHRLLVALCAAICVEAGEGAAATVDRWLDANVRRSDAPKGAIDALRLKVGTSSLTIAEAKMIMESVDSLARLKATALAAPHNFSETMWENCVRRLTGDVGKLRAHLEQGAARAAKAVVR